jgi:hypothetical protein
MTTFQSREAVRDALVTLFTADNSWQQVYGYFPGVDEIAGKSPLLIIRSRGTAQEFAGQDTNPVQYRFSVTSMTIADESATTSANAEDSLDTLDQKVRQVIRDNAAGGSAADLLEFEAGFSQVSDIIVNGLAYISETRGVIATLPRGAK